MTCFELVANTEVSNQFTVLKKYQGKPDCLIYDLLLHLGQSRTQLNRRPLPRVHLCYVLKTHVHKNSDRRDSIKILFARKYFI